MSCFIRAEGFRVKPSFVILYIAFEVIPISLSNCWKTNLFVRAEELRAFVVVVSIRDSHSHSSSLCPVTYNASTRSLQIALSYGTPQTNTNTVHLFWYCSHPFCSRAPASPSSFRRPSQCGSCMCCGLHSEYMTKPFTPSSS